MTAEVEYKLDEADGELNLKGAHGKNIIELKGTGRAVYALTNIVIVLVFLSFLIYMARSNDKVNSLRVEQCHDIQQMGIDAIQRDQLSYTEQAKAFSELSSLMRELTHQSSMNGQALNELLILERQSHRK